MNTCYDCVHPVRRLMLIATLIALSTTPRSSAAGPLWHAVVQSRRAGLPVVTIDLGYAGPYIPAINTPIALHATAGDVPFDGYIGFHFEVRGNRTLDTPVIARAKLRPHEAWSFTTFATLRTWGGVGTPGVTDKNTWREIAIAWLRSDMRELASESAGSPPWTRIDQNLLSLCIDCTRAFGADAYAVHAGDLSDRAQWYVGFANVVTPLSSWLDLPQRVKEAIFGSGTYVVFIGLPRQGQKLDAITRALLPVVFVERPGTYGAIWPYRAQTALIAAPSSWRAKDGAAVAGPVNVLSYIVSTNTAAWVADSAALAQPLPSMRATVKSELERQRYPVEWPASRGSLTEWRVEIAAVAAALLAIVAWIAMRKDRLAIAFALVIVAAATALIARQRLRAPAAASDRVLHASVAPDIGVTLRTTWIYGPTPLPAARADRTTITGDAEMGRNVEVRTSHTAPSMGELRQTADWDGAVRWTFRRDFARTPAMDGTSVIPQLRDLHGAMNWWWTRPARMGHEKMIDIELHKEADRHVWCAFVIPPNAASATLLVNPHLLHGVVEMRWASGSVQLRPVQKDVYDAAKCTVPADALRAIVASGGIAMITGTPDVTIVRSTIPAFYEPARLIVQEKKS